MPRIELGRIAGVPVYLDMFFVLVLILFTAPYFTAGNSQAMSMGAVIVIGLLASILLHELGHAAAGRMFHAPVSFIELTGLGGIAHFERSLPTSALKRSIIYLAGPAANLILWYAFDWMASQAMHAGKMMLAFPMAILASANFYLMVFNLLPAFPLDGGRTLEAWLGAVVGAGMAQRIVGGLGILVAAGIAYIAIPRDFWLMLLALVMFMANWEAFNTPGASGRWR